MLLALGVAILPPPSVSKRAIELSAALPAADAKGLRLDDDRLPHITLTQQFVAEQDVDAVLATIEATMTNYDTLHLNVTGPGRGQSAVWMSITPALDLVEEGVLGERAARREGARLGERRRRPARLVKLVHVHAAEGEGGELGARVVGVVADHPVEERHGRGGMAARARDVGGAQEVVGDVAHRGRPLIAQAGVFFVKCHHIILLSLDRHLNYFTYGSKIELTHKAVIACGSTVLSVLWVSFFARRAKTTPKG